MINDKISPYSLLEVLHKNINLTTVNNNFKIDFHKK